MALSYSQLESDRFGLRVHRGKMDALAPGLVRDYAIQQHADVVILRVPASQGDQLGQLQAPGLPNLVADTLVYYSFRFGDKPLQVPERKGVTVEAPSAYEPDEVEAMVRQIFGGYGNHYASNPWFSSNKILDGYADWAANFQGRPGETKQLFFLEQQGKRLGFLDAYYNPDTGQVDIGLTGMLQKASGQGLFSLLLPAAMQHFQERGAQEFWISTQVQNYAAQKAWHRAGFQFRHAYITMHFNPMLSHHEAEPIVHDTYASGQNLLQEQLAHHTGQTDWQLMAQTDLFERETNGTPWRLALTRTNGSEAFATAMRSDDKGIAHIRYLRWHRPSAS